MNPNHVHGPNCGCKEYQSLEEGVDLYGAIEIDKVMCLNEAEPDSGKKVFKPQDDKLDEKNFVESDVDPDLLFIVPFNQQVKIKAINIRGIDNDKYPVIAKIYKNEENVDFSIAESEPIQELMLGPNLGGEGECALKIMKFQNVHKLIIYLTNENQDQIGVTYIGVKGIMTNMKKDKIVIANYESKPNVKDHKTPNENQNFHSIQ